MIKNTQVLAYMDGQLIDSDETVTDKL